VGWSSPQARQIWVEYISSAAIQHDPFMLEFARLPGRFKTRMPEQLDERYWHTRAARQGPLAAGLGVCVVSLQKAVGAGAPTSQHFTFFRPPGASLFDRRERRLVHLFHGEIGPLVGKALAGALEPSLTGLAPRLRQTLDCLLEGDSEKQVAARLGLSQPTVHEYIGVLYRHFGVSSRAELLAYFLRRFRGSRSWAPD
jgi:DNA-binding CsgD family transcriptional regulator